MAAPVEATSLGQGRVNMPVWRKNPRMVRVHSHHVRIRENVMKLTKAQREFLGNLKAMNTAGVTPNVSQVSTATGKNPPQGQTSYKYKVYKQLASRGLVGDLGTGRPHALRITRDGLRAIREV